MAVRRAQAGDAAALGEIHVRTWRAAYEHVFGAARLAGMRAGRRTEQWRGWLAQGVDAWVCEGEDGSIVGFVWIGDSREAEREGELFAIYVLPEAWGSPAGRELMAVARDALRAAYPTSILWVLEDNPRARRFYEREGWSLDGGRKEEELLGAIVTEVRYRLSETGT
jgi:ribosomal protein S18 acetylase RimI-like enzyme